MVGGVLYYVMLFCLGLSIAIYNFSVYSVGNVTTCYVAADDTTGQASATPTAIGSNTTANTTNSTVATTISLPGGATGTKSSNILALLQIIIAVCYIIISVLSIILVLIINNMANMVPDDFLTISSCKRFLASFTKICPPLFIVIHYVILIVILVIWILIVTSSCSYSVPAGSTYFDSTKYFKQSQIANLVTTVFWFFLHYVGAIIRDIVYQEPFMFSPTIGRPSFMGSCMKKIGP